MILLYIERGLVEESPKMSVDITQFYVGNLWKWLTESKNNVEAMEQH